MKTETYKKVFIKSERDLPKVPTTIYLHVKSSTDLRKAWSAHQNISVIMKECDWYLLPVKSVPVKEKTEDELDLMQYVTNLLYAAYIHESDSTKFDKWVEEKTNELSEYYANQFKVTR